MSIRNVEAIALITLVTLGVLLPVGARAHGQAEELFETAEIVMAPYTEVPPVIDGSILPDEYSAYGRWVDEDTGLVANFVRDADSIVIGLESPSLGWIGIGFSSDLESGMGFVLAGNQNGTLSVEERVTMNVSDEMVFTAPNPGSTTSILAFNGSMQGERITAEFRLALESDLWTLEPGALVPTVVAFNETSREIPRGTEGSDVHFLRTYIFRAQDNPEEIRQLFAAEISPIPGLVAVAVMTLGVGGLGVAFLRQRGARP